MVFWNPKKKRTTAKPKTTASISKPKVGSVKQELNILPQPKKTDNPKPNKVPKNEDVKKQFLKTFNQLTYRHRSWDVWRDFIIMFACSLSNPVDKFHYEEREKRYLKIIKKYNKREQEQFPELAAYVVMALEENPEQDFLGSIFMELNLGDKSNSQFFTPYHVCELMAKVTEEDVAAVVKEKGYITINDSCCGAGATLIAAINEARKQLEKVNLNFQNHVLVVAQDIDEIVALMCYIQLSLLGVAAYIKVGDVFTQPMSTDDNGENYWFTMMYFSDVWTMRRVFTAYERMTNMIKTVSLKKEDCYCDLATFYENVARKISARITDKSKFDCRKICVTKDVQEVLWSYYREEKNQTDEQIASILLIGGPKANLEEYGILEYRAEVENGFVSCGENPDGC